MSTKHVTIVCDKHAFGNDNYHAKVNKVLSTLLFKVQTYKLLVSGKWNIVKEHIQYALTLEYRL